MAPGNLKINGIMPGSNSHNTRAEFHVYCFIFYHRGANRSVNPFQFYFLSVVIFRIALVVGMHNNIFISEFCFRSGGGDDERPVLEVVKIIRLFYVRGFKIRKRSLMFWAPVDDSLAAVY